MAKDIIANAEFEEEKEFTLPKGATIVKKSETISVRKIRNGYVLRKSYDIKWKPKDSDDTQYEYFTHEWYSIDNPMTINIPREEKSLAEKLG